MGENADEEKALRGIESQIDGVTSNIAAILSIVAEIKEKGRIDPSLLGYMLSCIESPIYNPNDKYKDSSDNKFSTRPVETDLRTRCPK
jgi:hypothetical protein